MYIYYTISSAFAFFYRTQINSDEALLQPSILKSQKNVSLGLYLACFKFLLNFRLMFF